MLTKFEQYLVDRGFKRTCIEHCGKNEKEDYESTFLSTYNPFYYKLSKDDKCCYWGLSEYKKPPVMFLGNKKMVIVQNKQNYRTNEDGYRILFSQWLEDKFDEIYEVFMSKKKYFKINVEDENNISIKILEGGFHQTNID